MISTKTVDNAALRPLAYRWAGCVRDCHCERRRRRAIPVARRNPLPAGCTRQPAFDQRAGLSGCRASRARPSVSAAYNAAKNSGRPCLSKSPREERRTALQNDANKIATGNGINGTARDESQYVMPGAWDNPTNAVPPHFP